MLLSNLLLEYLIYMKNISILEFFFQLVLVYNLIQLFKQNNFFFTLAYFLNFIVFVGLVMILYDLDLGAIILWIIYGGVFIIFFLYALMWIETFKVNVFFFESRFVYYFSFYIFIYILFFNNIIELDWIANENFKYNLIFYYEVLVVDIYEELESLGDSFFFFSLFFFVLSTIVLVITCFCIVVLIINLKKLKYFSFFSFFSFINKQFNFFKYIVLKNQHFYAQEYDSTYLKQSISRIFKISVSFHKLQKNLKYR